MKRLRIGANHVQQQMKSLRGQGMVEFALAIPVFLLLILGIMEFSWMLFHYSITFSASREAARYGSSVGLGSTNISREIDCVGIRAEAYRVGRPAGITTAGQVDIRYDHGPDDPTAWDDLERCDALPVDFETILGDRIGVRVTANHSSLIGIFPSFPITSTTFRTIIKRVDMTANPTAPAGMSTNTPTCTVMPTATPTPTETLTPTLTFTPLPQADITVSKNDGVSYYIPGGTVTYTIYITNAGPNDAIGCILEDNRPFQVTTWDWTCTTAGGATGCDAYSGSGNIWDTGLDIPVGGSIAYTVTANLNPAAQDYLINYANIILPYGLGDDNGGLTAIDIDWPPAADLSVTAVSQETYYVPGEDFTFSFTVANAGPDAANFAVVSAEKPDQVENYTWSCVAVGGASCHNQAVAQPTFSDTMDYMPAGGSVTYTVNAHIAAAATDVMTFNVNVVPPVGISDLNMDNNYITISATPPTADIWISISDNNLSNYPRGTLTYTVRLYNWGPEDASNVYVVSAFPDASVISKWDWVCSGASGGASGCSGASNSSWEFSDYVDIPAGGEIIYSVTVTILNTAMNNLIITVDETAPAPFLDPDAPTLQNDNNSAMDINEPPAFSCNNLTIEGNSWLTPKRDITIKNNTSYPGHLTSMTLAFQDRKTNQNRSYLDSSTFGAAIIQTANLTEPGGTVSSWNGTTNDRLLDFLGSGNISSKTLSLNFVINSPPLTFSVITLEFLFVTPAGPVVCTKTNLAP